MVPSVFLQSSGFCECGAFVVVWCRGVGVGQFAVSAGQDGISY